MRECCKAGNREHEYGNGGQHDMEHRAQLKRGRKGMHTAERAVDAGNKTHQPPCVSAAAVRLWRIDGWINGRSEGRRGVNDTGQGNGIGVGCSWKSLRYAAPLPLFESIIHSLGWTSHCNACCYCKLHTPAKDPSGQSP